MSRRRWDGHAYLGPPPRVPPSAALAVGSSPQPQLNHSLAPRAVAYARRYVSRDVRIWCAPTTGSQLTRR